MKNIFIEGVQGSGKSTLLNRLAQQLPAYKVYREGDICPVELAYCGYLTQEQYDSAKERFRNLAGEMDQRSVREGEYWIVPYTKIRTENRDFYQYMEQYEIYNSRRTPEEFCSIVLRRYLAWKESGVLLECAFFQNILEELMLYALFSEEEILAFYRKLFSVVDQEKFQMLYLYSDETEANVEQAKRERVDENGQEVWFGLMLQYLNDSPYGKTHSFETVSDVAAHFRRRAELEQKLIREVLKERCIQIPAKQYELEEVMMRLQIKTGGQRKLF